MSNFKKLKGFTLAEIMIVLTVIGILTGILMPIAIQSAPDENVMKFKKAHNTLTTTIREMVNSDKYYLDGDLGFKPDGTLIDGTHDGDYTYFCETFADILSSVKKKNCSSITNPGTVGNAQLSASATPEDIENMQIQMDTKCKTVSIMLKQEIITSDNVAYFQVNPRIPYGISYGASQQEGYGRTCDGENCAFRLFDYDWHRSAVNTSNLYKIFCVDIDGVPNNATTGNCINECPFGYGIRTDGKIFPGIRAQEWLEKSVQRGD